MADGAPPPRGPEPSPGPISAPGVRIARRPGPRLRRIAFWPDRFARAAAALCAELRVAMPAPGRLVSAPGARLQLARLAPTTLWLFDGPDGDAAPFVAPEDGALSEIGPGLATLRLDGPRAADLLARAVPLDLRPAAFPADAIAAAGWRHAQVALRRAPDGFDLLVPLSFADDLEEVLRRHARQFA
ncbi:MAG: hypothetical protein AAF763_17695 [Pseudomonadota bacterium]